MISRSMSASKTIFDINHHSFHPRFVSTDTNLGTNYAVLLRLDAYTRTSVADWDVAAV